MEKSIKTGGISTLLRLSFQKQLTNIKKCPKSQSVISLVTEYLEEDMLK